MVQWSNRISLSESVSSSVTYPTGWAVHQGRIMDTLAMDESSRGGSKSLGIDSRGHVAPEIGNLKLHARTPHLQYI